MLLSHLSVLRRAPATHTDSALYTSDNQKITSVDDILARDPMDTLREAYQLEYQEEMSDLQTKMLQELLHGIVNQTND